MRSPVEKILFDPVIENISSPHSAVRVIDTPDISGKVICSQLLLSAGGAVVEGVFMY